MQLAKRFVRRPIILKEVRQHELRDEEEHFKQTLTAVRAEIGAFVEVLASERVCFYPCHLAAPWPIAGSPAAHLRKRPF